MRGCFLGNSHLAAIKKGWDLIVPYYPDLKFDMFASPGATLSKTFVRDGHLCSADEEVRASLLRTGGRENVPLHEYDIFVVVGCDMRIDKLWEVFATHNFVESDGQLISKGHLSAYLGDRFARCCATQLTRRIRSAVDVPIYVMPNPYPDSRILARPRAKGFADVRRAGALPELKEMFETACTGAVVSKAHMLFQDVSTIKEDVFTQKKFSTGAPRLLPGNVAHAPQELFHMNADYGVAMLEKLLATVDIVKMHPGSEQAAVFPELNAESRPPAEIASKNVSVVERVAPEPLAKKRRFWRLLASIRK